MVRTRVSMRQGAMWCVELGAGTPLAQGKRTCGAHSRRLRKVRFFPSSLNTPLSCVKGRLCLKPHSVKLWSPARVPLLEPPDLYGLGETKVLLSPFGGGYRSLSDIFIPAPSSGPSSLPPYLG